MAQDSSLPDFWETRYRDHVTPWEAGGVPLRLQRFARELAPGARILIPGCGSGHEASLLSEAGFDVLAIDFSQAAVDLARSNLGRFADRVQLADFFAFDAGDGFDVMIERAFLCALPRGLWPDYAARAAQLVRPGGTITGFWFLGDTLHGPPFGTSEAALQALLRGGFERMTDEPVEDSLAVFAGRERWQSWRRYSR